MNIKKIQRIVQKCITALHIVLVILMVALGLLALFQPSLIKTAIDWLGIQIQSWGSWNYLILFLVAMVESFPFLGIAVPGMNVMILVGGFFIMHNWSIFPFAAILAMAGACLGNALGYFMGKYGDPTSLAKYEAIFGIGPREKNWLQKQIEKNGFWFIVGGKFHNLTRAFVPYLAGSHHMSGRKFWFANLLGSSLWAVLILLLGMFAVQYYETVLTYLNYIVLGILVIVGGIYFLKQKKK